jgi:hypothetical protein
MLVHGFDRQGAEYFVPIAARYTQALENVPGSLFQRQGERFRPERDALPELPKVPLVQFLFDFRLSRQHDLEEFVCRSLQIRQQTDFFQRLK